VFIASPTAIILSRPLPWSTAHAIVQEEPTFAIPTQTGSEFYVLCLCVSNNNFNLLSQLNEFEAILPFFIIGAQILKENL